MRAVRIGRPPRRPALVALLAGTVACSSGCAGAPSGEHVPADAALESAGPALVVPLATPGRDHPFVVSTDAAVLAFARMLGADDGSRHVQAAFERFRREGAVRSERCLRASGAFSYTVLFAPAWLYLSSPTTGADFARTRHLLGRLGITHRLIPTAESGSVEDNATIVADAVREARRRRETVVIVSASKSGAEVAIALSRRLDPEETGHVRGWLNVAGALGGTPLVDRALRPPVVWFARALFQLMGWDWAGGSRRWRPRRAGGVSRTHACPRRSQSST